MTKTQMATLETLKTMGTEVDVLVAVKGVHRSAIKPLERAGLITVRTELINGWRHVYVKAA